MHFHFFSMQIQLYKYIFYSTYVYLFLIYLLNTASCIRASSTILSGEEASELLFMIQCNAHRITHSNGQPVGLGLFPITSLMNHSCDPNCVHHFSIETEHPKALHSPPKLVMRALRDIVAGEELTYSYVDLYQSTKSRRKQLSQAYFFNCDCVRCRSADEEDTGVRGRLVWLCMDVMCVE